MKKILQGGSFAVGIVVLPFATAMLFNVGAEAFWGAKEPMFETLLGLMIGVILAYVLARSILAIDRAGRQGTATSIVLAVLACEALTVPLARWLIRTAYSSPSHVIDLW